MCKQLVLLLALLGAGGCLASAQPFLLESPCNPVINFFPTADEINPSTPITTTVYDYNGNATVVTCTGDDNCAYPEVDKNLNAYLGRPVFVNTSQSNYMSSLKTAEADSLRPSSITGMENGLLKVVLPPWGQPRLFFTVSSPLLAAKSDVTACIPINTAADSVAVRRLLRAQQTNVSQAGSWSFSVSIDGGQLTTGQKNGNAGVINLPSDGAAVGEHCAEVRVSISGFQLTPSSGAYANPAVVRKVCWYKPSDGHAQAKLKFDMCSTQAFTVNISSIAPLAQLLTQNGDEVLLAEDNSPALLFRPVLQLFGRKSRNLDGTQVESDAYDSSQDGTNFINRYIIPPTNITADSVLSYVLDENVLEEGYYNLSAKVSMISDFGNLLADSVGKGVIAQTDIYGAAVQGKTEILANNLMVYQEVGVQKSPTTLSEISSDKTNKAIKGGDSITFSWKFAGVKVTQNCYHGDTLISDCESPVTVQAKDVSADNTKATFTVEFTDVCGVVKKAQYSYTQSGVTAETKVDTITVASKPVARATGGAAALGANFVATTGMALVGAVMMALMLQ